jgi:hypothetical protein
MVLMVAAPAVAAMVVPAMAAVEIVATNPTGAA